MINILLFKKKLLQIKQNMFLMEMNLMNYQKGLSYYQQNITFFPILVKIYFTRNDGSQNMFVYQPNNMIKYLNTSTEYIISWRSKGVYNA